MTTMGDLQNLPKWRKLVLLLASFLGLLAGVCTIFALIVTMVQDWQEHVHAQWPEATAHVQRCGLEIYTHKHESYRIDCTVSYDAQGEAMVAHLYSRSTPAPRRVIVQQQGQEFDTMQRWVDQHPEGTPIVVHYDPADHRNAVLVATDMPRGGPRTPNNLKLVGAAGASCALFLVIARIARPRADAVR